MTRTFTLNREANTARGDVTCRQAGSALRTLPVIHLVASLPVFAYAAPMGGEVSGSHSDIWTPKQTSPGGSPMI